MFVEVGSICFPESCVIGSDRSFLFCRSNLVRGAGRGDTIDDLCIAALIDRSVVYSDDFDSWTADVSRYTFVSGCDV